MVLCYLLVECLLDELCWVFVFMVDMLVFFVECVGLLYWGDY